MTEEDHEDALKMLEEIDEDATGLSEWEEQFVADLIDREQKRFSWRQAERISVIWEDQFG